MKTFLALVIATGGILLLAPSVVGPEVQKVPETSIFLSPATSATSATPSAVPTRAAMTSFHYTFNTSEILQEADSPRNSHSPYWWLDSGGELIIENGIGMTIQGDLPAMDPWRLEYVLTNPLDTDGGYHPQNIFRLLTKSVWHNFTEQVYFKVTRDNASTSPNRNESNGLLLFARYQPDGDLYYAGVRVDGAAVIKKKIRGQYYELAYSPAFGASPKQAGPGNLLPAESWLGLRLRVADLSGGRVGISLSIDSDRTGKWRTLISVVDDGRNSGGPAITEAGRCGIRTDFMDVVFSDFLIESL